MNTNIKDFCKTYKVKFEDYNEDNNLLITSKICNRKAWKLNWASKPENIKYRFFEYYYIKGNDFITIDTKKQSVDYIGALFTYNEIQRLKELIIKFKL